MHCDQYARSRRRAKKHHRPFVGNGQHYIVKAGFIDNVNVLQRAFDLCVARNECKRP
jgi:hypothetical protein